MPQKTTPAGRWPNRHRLYGGRNTHATRPAPGMPYGITACHKSVNSNDYPQDDNAPVTCRDCNREINR